jgi:hypothetical protein
VSQPPGPTSLTIKLWSKTVGKPGETCFKILHAEFPAPGIKRFLIEAPPRCTQAKAGTVRKPAFAQTGRTHSDLAGWAAFIDLGRDIGGWRLFVDCGPLQMFTHLSPTSSVSEQNPLKNAKIEAPWSAPSTEGGMQRSAGNVCLTDRRRLGEALLEQN